MVCVLIQISHCKHKTDSDVLVVLYRYSRVTCSTNVFTKCAYPHIQGFPIIYLYKIMFLILTSSGLTLLNDMNKGKLRKVKKAGSRQESNPGHLWLEPPAFCH